MRNLIVVTIILVLCGAPSAGTAAVRCIATKTGNWSDPSIWNTGTVPGVGDDAWIDLGSNVTVDIFGAVCADVFILNGTLKITSSSSVLSVSDFFTIGNDPANTGRLTMTAGTLLIGGNVNVTSYGTLDLTGGTIHLTGSGQDLDAGTYYDLRMSGGVKTATGDITVSGTLTIMNGASFDGGAFTHRVTGDWINDGTYLPGTSTVILTSDVAQTLSGDNAFHHLTFTGAGIKTLSGTLLVGGNVTVGAVATVRAGTSSIDVAGNWTCNGTFNGQDGDVNFDGPTITIAGNAKFHHVSVRGPTNVTCQNNLTMDGAFSNSIQATFDLNANTMSVGGAWSNHGIFKGTGSTVVMNGSLQQQVIGTTKFENLTIDNPAGIQLAVGSIDTVLGSLTFSNGAMWLLNGEVHLGVNSGVVGAGNGKCIITNSVGVVQRRVTGGVGATPFTFPVGAGASSFDPVTINLRSTAGEPNEIFRVKVADLTSGSPGFGSIDTAFWVQRVWAITEVTPGGNHANLSFQWDRGEQGSLAWPARNAAINAGFFLYDPGAGVYQQFDSGTGPAPFAGPLTASSGSYKATVFGSMSVGPDLALPVQLSSFTATRIAGTRVTLAWTTLSEIQNYGFYVQRRKKGATPWEDLAGSFQSGHGTTTTPHQYTYTDSLAGTDEREYRLDQRDLNGTVHYSDPVSVSGLTDIPRPKPLPAELALAQNYPNPFNPSTTITFTIPAASDGRAGEDVRLSVYDVLGQELAVLFDGKAEAGLHRFTFDGAHLSTGVYFCRLRTTERSTMIRMTLLR